MRNEEDDILNRGEALYEARDYAQAKQLLWPLAQTGYAAAQYIVADMYRWGTGLEQDPHLARHYFELAANQGHARAAFDLGMWLSSDKVGPESMNVFGKDAEKAKHYFTIALRGFHELASLGDSFGMHYLGLLYSTGIGVELDAAEAIRWYTLAFEAGHHFSANGLAGIYYGSLDPRIIDRDKALFWYRKLKEFDCQAIGIDELERLVGSGA